MLVDTKGRSIGHIKQPLYNNTYIPRLSQMYSINKESDLLLKELFYVTGSNLVSTAWNTLHVSPKIKMKISILTIIIAKCACTIKSQDN